MDYKPRPWQLILLIALLCGVTVGGMVWYRSRALTPSASLRRMPMEDTLVLWIDFAALRGDGLLQLLDGAKAGQDPEYQTFVRQTRFDYMHDLDSVMVAFAPTGNFFLVRGRFDWKSIQNYVEQVNGNCVNTLCRVKGSGPDRRISFFPVHRDLMAMAASPDDYAALRLSSARPGPDPPVPNAPVWIAFPGSLLKSGKNLPDGARPFARAMESALSVTISIAPEGDRLAARLDVRSNSDREAAAAAAQLTEATQLLRSLIARENLKPNPADPSGVLAAGAFHAEGAHVAGVWPVPREFVQNLLGTQ
ncbi:MAG: hypothetical protein ABSH40_22795 [Bryobacteraceae bacterium]